MQRQQVARSSSLAGKTVGLLDISKARGDVFLNTLATRLTKMGLTVQRYRKPNFTRVAPAELLGEIRANCNLVVEALAD